MDTRPLGGFVRRWAGPDSTPARRAVVGVPIGAATLVGVTILVETSDTPGEAVLLPAALVAIAVGFFIRTWLALPAAYLGFVLTAWIAETAYFIYLGGGEWAVRNSEHWQGNEAASLKLLGQLFEYLVFLLLTVPFIAIGVVIGRGVGHLAGGADRHGHAGA